MATNALGVIALTMMICIGTGCVATAPMSRKVSSDPVLARQGGVLLLLDSCVQIDVLGGADNYFVVNETEVASRAMLGALHKYIEDSGVSVRTELTSVCASWLNGSHSPIRVSDSVGGPVRLSQQPLRVPDSIKADTEYVNALGVLSTFAIERAAVVPEKQKKADKTGLAAAPANISMDAFHAASAIVRDRTHASSIIFVGALGTKPSAGKAAAEFLGRLTIGTAIAVATAGLGTGYYLIFVPGHQINGVVMEGALVDLDSGALTWSNAVRVNGNPLDPKAMADPQNIDLLLHGIVFSRGSAN